MCYERQDNWGKFLGRTCVIIHWFSDPQPVDANGGGGGDTVWVFHLNIGRSFVVDMVVGRFEDSKRSGA